MFRDRVVGHYVGRGYRVDTDAVLEGESGGKHKVDLVATDDLGRITIWWGDREPFEGPELESVKRAARDLGAAPAIATPAATSILRDNARQHGVVIVDEPLLDSESAKMARPLPPRPLADSPGSKSKEYPPWPDPTAPAPSSAEGADASPAVEAPWREEPAAEETEAVQDGARRPFDWLPEEGAATDGAGGGVSRRRAVASVMPAFWGPLLYAALAVLVILIVLAFVL